LRLAFAIAVLAALPVSQTLAAPKLYNMDSFFAEPHPFAPRPGAPVVQAPARPAVPVPAPAPPPRQYVEPVDSTDEIEPINDIESEDDGDPLEPVNRFIFGFNEIFLDYLLGPLTDLYTEFVPSPVRAGIGNLLDNINAPVVLANDLLQAEGGRALETTERFVINSVFGVAGIFDVASSWGLPKHEEDFGQTLGVWGVDEMFYVVLPLFGPSSPRDAVGRFLVDDFFDPIGLWLDNTDREEISLSLTGIGALDEYAGVKDKLATIKETSIDYYAAVRSLYRQKREADIRNGTAVAIPDLDEGL
jgi:phospholipid-binding lipoprotein MlaA